LRSYIDKALSFSFILSSFSIVSFINTALFFDSLKERIVKAIIANQILSHPSLPSIC
jgi:hypothetical protein